jgi:hypothetical protein
MSDLATVAEYETYSAHLTQLERECAGVVSGDRNLVEALVRPAASQRVLSDLAAAAESSS